MSASGASNAQLRYDPLGRLYEVAAGANVTRFLYDGDELVIEYNAVGTQLRRYAHGSGVDDPVIWWEGVDAGDPRWLMADHQGSIVAGHDAFGNVVMNRYDTWGQPGPITWGGSAIRARPGCRSSGSTITRPGCTRRGSGGSCRSTRWGMTIS